MSYVCHMYVCMYGLQGPKGPGLHAQATHGLLLKNKKPERYFSQIQSPPHPSTGKQGDMCSKDFTSAERELIVVCVPTLPTPQHTPATSQGNLTQSRVPFLVTLLVLSTV